MITFPVRQRSRETEWQSRLLASVAGLLAFETLTGLSIYLLPFSVPNQIVVLVHTAVGLGFVTPFAWYQVRHWWNYRHVRMSHVKLTGYFAMVAAVAAVVSGVALTFQAAFLSRISYAWDVAHIVATFAVIASAVPHIVMLLAASFTGRAAPKPLAMAQRRFVGASSLVATALATALGLLWYAHEPDVLNEAFPADYSYLYGEERPFAPSLARTNTGGALDARALGGSESCGTSGCHEEIVGEWKVSAHRYSAMDVAFQAIQNVMAEQNGAESTRYCGGCHDPISLFSGAKNVFTDDLTNLVGYQEGVSCISCHAITETDVQGNADYVMTQPRRYMFELRDGRSARFLRDFLIRSYPRNHVESLQHRMFKSPQFCAACHKQFIDEEINQVGWVQLQNQFDNWRKSRWNHPDDPTATIECRECHMPLTNSRDPARGDVLDYNRSADDGKHRSHRFLGANQFMPELLGLDGATVHAELIEKWMRGAIDIPEIADKWKQGAAVPIELVAPDTVALGEKIRIQAVLTNNKVGHDFPTGPLDIIQAWVEVVVTDQDGNVVFESGRVDEDHFIEPGSFMFKAEPVDQYGNLIDRHNLWEMVGVRYRRALFPGFSDRAEYSFLHANTSPANGAGGVNPTLTQDVTVSVPSQNVRVLRAKARLLYRKVDQFLLNFLFGVDADITAHVTVMSEDERTIYVAAGQ